MDKKNKNPNVPNLRFSQSNCKLEAKCLEQVSSYFKSGKNISSSKIESTGIYPVYGGNGLRGYTKEFNHTGLSILIGRQGALCGNVKIVDGKYYATEHAIVVKNNQYADLYYLAYLLMSMHLERESDQSAQPGLAVNKIIQLKAMFPPIDEQQKIGMFLHILDERIQTQNKIIDDYNSLKMGIYNWMFKENYADYKLKQLAYIVKGDQINNDQLLSNGSYYMMNGGISPSGYLDSYNVSENTISISEGGNSCGYVQFNSSPFWSGGHCYTIQNVNSALIENKYLYHYLKHKEKEIMNLRIGTGLPNIQKKDLENFTIFVPSLLIQRKNLALFEMLDKKICILNEELERLEIQKKYLLRNMFI